MSTGEERYALLAMRLAAALLAVLLAALAGSGVWLASHYRPGVSPPLRSAHLGAAVLLVPVSLTFVAAAVVHRRPRWPAGVVVVMAVAAAFSTGILLAWDQLALGIVRVGEVYEGVFRPFTDDIRYVIVDDVEVGVGAYRLRVVEHLVGIPAVLAAAAGFLLRR